MYILDKKTEEITTQPSSSGDKFVAHLDDFPEPLTADVLIAAQDQLPVSLHPSPAQDTHVSLIARCIAVIDKPILFPPLLFSEEEVGEDDIESAPVTPTGKDAGGQGSESTARPEAPEEAPPVDTSIIIFPPRSVNAGSSTQAAEAFTTGAGTLSAPRGKCENLSYYFRRSRLIHHM